MIDKKITLILVNALTTTKECTHANVESILYTTCKYHMTLGTLTSFWC